jgi:hypothetical protein
MPVILMSRHQQKHIIVVRRVIITYKSYADQIYFKGMSAPAGTVSLGLYWKALTIIRVPLLDDQRRRPQARQQEAQGDDGENDGHDDEAVSDPLGVLEIGRDARRRRHRRDDGSVRGHG